MMQAMSEAKICRGDLCEMVSPGFFRALADPNRVAILDDLASCCGGSKTVGEVAAGLPTDLSVVSRHLGVLRDAGVLEAERQGRTVRYRVRYGALVTLLRSLADAIESCCPSEDEIASGSRPGASDVGQPRPGPAPKPRPSTTSEGVES